jgi:hypothetical protein
VVAIDTAEERPVLYLCPLRPVFRRPHRAGAGRAPHRRTNFLPCPSWPPFDRRTVTLAAARVGQSWSVLFWCTPKIRAGLLG